MKFFKNILFILLGLSFVMVTGEAPTAIQQLLWSGSWLAVMAISALTLNHLEKKEAKHETESK
jgi:hypothetical protein